VGTRGKVLDNRHKKWRDLGLNASGNFVKHLGKKPRIEGPGHGKGKKCPKVLFSTGSKKPSF
jgi:hypothetical protein